MYIADDTHGQLGAWIRDEIEFDEPIAQGNRGKRVERIQEWLCLHGLGLIVDGDFGPITAGRITSFQDRSGIAQSGTVDEPTFAALTAPMRDALKPLPHVPETLGQTMIAIAENHLKAHPREIGGQNKGPWVRLYMDGNQGRDWLWCAGFTTFIMHQAAELLGQDAPIDGSVSCDTLASQAKAQNLFVGQADATPETVSPGSMFLVRRTKTDWTHTGLVVRADATGIDTIEGNTNDDGVAEGYEVCSRRRAYAPLDFVGIS